ncbi:hypothetical protein [Paenibacillus flagellatus]|uniref:Uncharacterized protein n=1 Tax=Paenibacillus flagellatus TaxID=2211139 RepID=A0A2V5K4R4_9BACL|nr:hypothetical protein [Paenibacillus flagellatus]PYI54271.1 hypothetical protein DLM86_12385 [Paenibacillus flagellatus]
MDERGRNRIRRVVLVRGRFAGVVRVSAPGQDDEGIPDWKEIGWVTHPDNAGVASSAAGCLENALLDEACFDYHCVFSKGRMTERRASRIDPRVEEDEAIRADYLNRYRMERTLNGG